uniref:Uncharacterized protein n=1 Tax=Knipowitschia caucasica TaxID=637954 RepID=A0AAV2M3V3_KNICA
MWRWFLQQMEMNLMLFFLLPTNITNITDLSVFYECDQEGVGGVRETSAGGCGWCERNLSRRVWVVCEKPQQEGVGGVSETSAGGVWVVCEKPEQEGVGGVRETSAGGNLSRRVWVVCEKPEQEGVGGVRETSAGGCGWCVRNLSRRVWVVCQKPQQEGVGGVSETSAGGCGWCERNLSRRVWVEQDTAAAERSSVTEPRVQQVRVTESREMPPPADIVKVAIEWPGANAQLIEMDQKRALNSIIREVCDG